MKRARQTRLRKIATKRRGTPSSLFFALNAFREAGLSDSGTTGSKAYLLLDALAKLAVLGTLGYGILEYSSSLEDKQRIYSFEIIEDWENNDYREAFRVVSSQINEIRETLPTEYRSTGKRQQLETNFVGAKLLEVIANNPKFESEVRELYYFYSKTGICGLDEICDEELLKAFFKAGAEDFLAYLHPYTQLVRQSGQANFGLYAERFFLD